ncbi:MAG: FMN-binding glutamate synthase family protein [Cyclobacteriaceae bacterium]
MRTVFYKLLFITILIEVLFGFFWPVGLWSLLLILPIALIGLNDILNKKQAIRRNFPILGNLRYIFEKIRPEIMQYFVETDTEGRPINRIYRSMVYRRAKKVNDTTPFGTQENVYKAGYEWMSHSMNAINHTDLDHNQRIRVGSKDCNQPYEAALMNVSAMSYGSLSENAVLALNRGAREGCFYHNTGEGGISPFHLKNGGDLVWQIGTGYFGCRDAYGRFSPENFAERAALPNVKMIEIKLSQGAKPGHGGILPASKNTPEIAAIRGVKPNTMVFSPPVHSAFEDAIGLLNFVKQLRDLSEGKPVGFKLCVGLKSEFTDLCEAMLETGITPDFITVDGGEGGTGAAPLEFSNSLGMPLRDALAFVHDTLRGYDLRGEIKLIASGRIFSSFHIVRAIALGADIVNSARGMMLALGCIQALQCNSNTCPTGVATQDKLLMGGLNAADKSVRVANFQEETVKAFYEMLGAAGMRSPSEIKREHINRRVSMTEVRTYEDLFPTVKKGSKREAMTV